MFELNSHLNLQPSQVAIQPFMQALPLVIRAHTLAGWAR